MTKKTADLLKVYQKANLSQHAEDCIGNFIYERKLNEIEEFEDDELFNYILCSEEIIYYSDAFNYLMEEMINDFSEAINNNCYDVSQIANFYLQNEMMEKIFYKL